MKLKIELDIEPHEVELASELINTLRSLTEHVKVNSGGTKGSSQTQPVEIKPPQSNSHGPPPAAISAQQPPRQETQPQRIPEPAVATGADWASKLTAYQIAEGKQDRRTASQIASEIIASLPKTVDTVKPDPGYEAFFNVLENKLFVSRNKDNPLTLELCKLLTEMPPELMNDMKTRVISAALRHLMIKRPIAADRTEFFAHAEVFAAMANLEFILITGAVQTISKLMKKEDTRAAAVTMLGTTTQLCSEQMLSQVDERKLAALRSALDEVTEPEMDYDKQYIQEALHWGPTPNGQSPSIPQPNGISPAAPAAPAQPAAAPQPVQPQAQNPTPAAKTVVSILKLTPQTQWTGYTHAVKGIVVDDKYNQIVTTSNDGTLRLYNGNGQELQRTELGTHFFTDVDYNATTRAIVGAGGPLSKEPGAKHIYSAYQLDQGSMKLIGSKPVPANVALVHKLRFLAKGSEEFICAEQKVDKSLLVSRYSPSKLKEEGDLVPISSYETDHGMITSISAVPTSPLAFLTADRSGKIYIWDARVAQPVITLLPPELETNGNDGVITCLDTLDPNFVVAGTYGQGVNVWDLRLLQRESRSLGLKPLANIPLDKEPVTRLARVPDAARQIVVAAANSIVTVYLNEDGSFNSKVDGKKASPKYYWDAKWSVQNGNRILYAASAGPPAAVDVYHANPTTP